MEFYESDVVVIVAGQVGSGRSTFINSLLPTEKPMLEVGSGLAACTSDVACSIIESGYRPEWSKTPLDYRLVLVDTPGFDEERRDRSIIAKIKIWVKRAYPAGKPRGGIIYMHDSKTTVGTAYLSRESQILIALKSILRGELCFVVTKMEELPDEGRVQVDQWFDHRWRQLSPHQPDIYRVKAQNHIGVCVSTQNSGLACDHHVWEPVDYLLNRSATQPLHDDMVLLVTGLTGSGKSTFVNDLWKEPARHQMQVSESGSLLPCTTRLDHVVLDLKKLAGCGKDYRLVLMDTPGFGNPDKPFKVILEETIAWFREAFPTGECRGGIIYLHDITLNRFQAAPEVQPLGASLRWGRQSLHVVTTKWGLLHSVEERNSVMKAVDTCVTQFSNDVKVHHCFEGGDATGIVASILSELEGGSGFAFHNKAPGPSRESSRRRYETSISTLIEVIKALLRASRGS